MGFGSADDGDQRRGRRDGLGGFVRSLLAGIPWSECAEADEEQRFPARAELVVENPNGRTRIVGEDRDDVLVRVHKRARAENESAANDLLERIRIDAQTAPDVLTIEVHTPRRWNRHGHAHLELRVPRQTRIRAHGNNGKICIEGLRAAVQARSSNGAVRVSDVDGDVSVETSNAKVSCECTCGRLMARSCNGKIEIHEHRGSLDATTSNGLIRAVVEELGDAGVVLATSNGRIVLDLPDEVDAEVDLRVDNGMIRTQRPIEKRSGDATSRLRGRLGRGGVPIRLRTSNGAISLR